MLSLYISASTWLHRVPPGLKLTTLAAASILLLPATQLHLLFGACVLNAAGFLSLGAPGQRRLVCLIKTAGALALLIGVFQFSFSIQDTGYETAIQTASVSALRLLSLVLLADLVSVTTPLTSMLDVIRTTLKPFEVAISKMALMVLGRGDVSTKRLGLTVGLLIRSVSLLRLELAFINQALHVRAKTKTIRGAIPPLIRRLFQTNQQLAHALHSRLLRGADHPRIKYAPLSNEAPN